MVDDISAQRRRLSLGFCDPVPNKKLSKVILQHENSTDAENRGLLQELKAATLPSLVPESQQGRRISYSSQSDKQQKRKKSFDEKDTVSEGGETVTKEMLKELGLGICCRKGLKPESPNQDSFSITYVADMFSLYGVYDGHGPSGHDVSQFVKEMLPKLFLQHPKRASDPESALRDVFIKVQGLMCMCVDDKSLDASMSGCTVSMIYRPANDEYIVVAHVGDSRAVMAKGGAGEATDLTIDHKPNLPKEKEYIENHGGRVVFDGFYNYRMFAKGAMYPGLNMSRALGDTMAHKVGLNGVPDVEKIPLSKDKDKMILLCTDGVWEFIDSKEAVKLAMKEKTVTQAAESLSKLSWDRWLADSEGEITDDITAMCIDLRTTQKRK